MAKQDRSIKTREEILLGAARLINQRSYDHASVKDIATDAGFTQGALYFHFSTKEEIAHAIIEEQNNRSQRSASSILAKKLPAVETILQVITQFTRDLLQDPLIEAGVRLTTQPQMFESPPILPWTSWASIHDENLRRGIEEGDVKPTIDTRRYATHMTGAYAGTFILSGFSTGLADLMERICDLSIILIGSYAIPERQNHWIERALHLSGTEHSPLHFD